MIVSLFSRDWLVRYRDQCIILVSFFLSLLIGAILITLYGANPIEAYAQMVSGALGDTDAILATLARAVPLVLSTMSISIAFYGGMWNIGAEGQLYLGAFTAALIGIELGALPGLLLIPLGLLAGVGAATFWAWMPAKLSLDRDLNIVVLTIMLNSIAILFTTFMATGPYAGVRTSSGSTDKIAEAMRLTHFQLFGTLNTGAYIAIAAILIVTVLMIFSVWGYDWRCSRMNTRFARYGGIDVRKRQMSAMLLSGALAGLAGSLLVMGDHYRFLINISPGYTWTGMILAMMVTYSPVGGIIAALVYSVMSSGALQMEIITDIPQELVSVIVCCAVLFVTAGISIANRLANRIRED
ncbi:MULTISPECIES: ABC transporter permease [Aminobacterium]|jgi:simple sugar transport system permease protein|uniref:ABC transporter permease n=1 Tax=Aminobacterium TaxID=81466 RepID=UPI00257C911A|nr:ABC transporter permease [Aminobacterium sp. UBA4834]